MQVFQDIYRREEATTLYQQPLTNQVCAVKGAFQSQETYQIKTLRLLERKLKRLAALVDAEIQQNTARDVVALHELLESFEAPISRVADATTVFTQEFEERKYHAPIGDILNVATAAPSAYLDPLVNSIPFACYKSSGSRWDRPFGHCNDRSKCKTVIIY